VVKPRRKAGQLLLAQLGNLLLDLLDTHGGKNSARMSVSQTRILAPVMQENSWTICQLSNCGRRGMREW
jgi:hypothetical protein